MEYTFLFVAAFFLIANASGRAKSALYQYVSVPLLFLSSAFFYTVSGLSLGTVMLFLSGVFEIYRVYIKEPNSKEYEFSYNFLYALIVLSLVFFKPWVVLLSSALMLAVLYVQRFVYNKESICRNKIFYDIGFILALLLLNVIVAKERVFIASTESGLISYAPLLLLSIFALMLWLVLPARDPLGQDSFYLHYLVVHILGIYLIRIQLDTGLFSSGLSANYMLHDFIRWALFFSWVAVLVMYYFRRDLSRILLFLLASAYLVFCVSLSYIPSSESSLIMKAWIFFLFSSVFILFSQSTRRGVVLSTRFSLLYMFGLLGMSPLLNGAFRQMVSQTWTNDLRFFFSPEAFYFPPVILIIISAAIFILAGLICNDNLMLKRKEIHSSIQSWALQTILILSFILLGI